MCVRWEAFSDFLLLDVSLLMNKPVHDNMHVSLICDPWMRHAQNERLVDSKTMIVVHMLYLKCGLAPACYRGRGPMQPERFERDLYDITAPVPAAPSPN